MTRAQFAIAVGAPEKWVHNAAAALRRRIPYTAENARRLTVARAIQQALGVALPRADRLAAKALAGGVALPGDGNVHITVDLPHLLSAYAGRLSLAARHEPLRRGRPRATRGDARARARDYGIDLTLVDQHLAMTPEERLVMLNENAQFVSALRGAARR